MFKFIEFIVEQEIAKYAYDFDEYFGQLDEGLKDIKVVTEPKTPAASTGVPSQNSKGGNHWRKVREGASAYFSASPEAQKQMHKEADRVLGKKSLLGDEASNPKLAKSGKTIPEYRTKGLSMAPSTMSGIDVCPAASKECKAACLGVKGRGVMSNVKKARVERTNKYFEHPHLFYAKLDREIQNAKTTAHRGGQKLAVRLNVLSDIPHEHLAPDLFKKHSDVSFYDYTKIAGRVRHKNRPENYHMTMSSTGLNHPDSNWSHARAHLDKGGVVSMVFKIPSRGKASAQPLPTHVHDEETGKRYRVVDGDIHDHRHLDHEFNDVPKGEGIIAGLKLKGGAPNIKNAGKFAVDVENGIATAKKGEN